MNENQLCDAAMFLIKIGAWDESWGQKVNCIVWFKFEIDFVIVIYLLQKECSWWYVVVAVNSEPVVGVTAGTSFDQVVLSFKFKFEFDLLELVILLLLEEPDPDVVFSVCSAFSEKQSFLKSRDTDEKEKILI